MKQLNEKLSEALNIQPIEVLPSTEVVEVKDQVADDAEFARQNLRELIEKGSDAADHIIAVAKQSDHPRAFEVVAGMLKNLSDMNKDLLEIQKRKQDLQPKMTNNTQNLNIDKAVFVGSTAELLKQLKGNK
jgi:trehalose-6-phosphatase